MAPRPEIGSAGNGISSNLSAAGKAASAGIVSGLTLEALNNNQEKKLGLSEDIYKELVKGAKDGLKGGTSSFLKELGSVIFSAIFGSNKTATPMNLRIDTNITINGTATSSGELPGTMTFYIPGTKNLTSAPGYIPLYNKPLGIIYFECNDQIVYNVEEYVDSYQEIDPQYGNDIITVYHDMFEMEKPNIDFSRYLKINPAIQSEADIIVLNQEPIIYYHESSVNFLPYSGLCMPNTGRYYNIHLKYGVRFTLEIKPKNPQFKSQHIVKTFRINNVKLNIK